MMMLEEDQISFRSDSSMFEGIEDYSHQIAGMIGLRNVSNFIQAGVSNCIFRSSKFTIFCLLSACCVFPINSNHKDLFCSTLFKFERVDAWNFAF